MEKKIWIAFFSDFPPMPGPLHTKALDTVVIRLATANVCFYACNGRNTAVTQP